jgi:hypothetical protein
MADADYDFSATANERLRFKHSLAVVKTKDAML